MEPWETRNTWYVYAPHCEDPSGYGLANQPMDRPAQLVQGGEEGVKVQSAGGFRRRLP